MTVRDLRWSYLRRAERSLPLRRRWKLQRFHRRMENGFRLAEWELEEYEQRRTFLGFA